MQHRLEIARDSGCEPFFCAFNLFRRREETDLFCAVPEDCVVPPFLDEEAWLFYGKAVDLRTAPPGFDARAAAVGVRFNGFHLFQASSRGLGSLTVVTNRARSDQTSADQPS